jgi:hypothetical protein
MDHVEKPRCRYVQNESGEVVGWLVHGTGVKVYSIKGLDHALSRWFKMLVPKLLKGVTPA